jgi:hypothetical protein
MGDVFTDEAAGVWATEDGLIKGAFLNVYLAWITLQAGGNPFDVGPEYRAALEYIYDLMYTSKALNPASLQKDYNQQNSDYFGDKAAFMRQWPYFGNVARGDDNKAWYSEDKVTIGLPPVGPGGGGVLWILALTMALPDVGTIVPLYRILASLRLLDTLAGLTLVLSSTLTPFTAWVLVSFTKQVPYEIEEAAIMDGASLPQILWRILLPVTAPGLATMGLSTSSMRGTICSTRCRSQPRLLPKPSASPSARFLPDIRRMEGPGSSS